jgi:hypothetical protein
MVPMPAEIVLPPALRTICPGLTLCSCRVSARNSLTLRLGTSLITYNGTVTAPALNVTDAAHVDRTYGQLLVNTVSVSGALPACGYTAHSTAPHYAKLVLALA